MHKHYLELETPALLVNKPIMEDNIRMMIDKAREAGVKLRPHTKTHRTPKAAKLQVEAGAHGITVAKVGEAEVMAGEGLQDIFIANEIYGDGKFLRLRDLNRQVRIAVGVDNREQVEALSRVFAGENKPLDVLIEIETGEERTGVLTGEDALSLARLVTESPGLRLRGIFSHEGHTYGASSPEMCAELFRKSQEDTLTMAEILRQNGIPVEEVSIGATPSLMHGKILPGITEIRPGTYIYMDAAQGHALGDYSRCALTILATVISKPTAERVVVDAGVKALTAFTRAQGICHTPGYGLVKGFNDLRLKKLYDEHGIILSAEANSKLQIGDKIEIIPNHACPTCNLYDKIYVIENEKVVDEWPILCRGKSQ
ncbi:MAG: alanine racemase [Peptococcaceae bacterium]|nr:alanine racemase [Peptococcaceae bacterium]